MYKCVCDMRVCDVEFPKAIYIYIYIYMCVCVCVCACERVFVCVGLMITGEKLSPRTVDFVYAILTEIYICSITDIHLAL